MKIFGRDKITKRIKLRLQEKSIIFAAERRVGKTTVLDKLEDDHDSDECIMIYRDLEKIRSVYELEEEVYDSVKEYFDFFSKVHLKKRFTQLETFAGKIKKEGIKYKVDKKWKEPFQDAIKSVCSSTEKRVIFLWDELPYMLQNIYEQDMKDKTQHAFDLLDILRTLDAEVGNLRFVFTGSIGLHHVEKMIKQGRNSEPFNNMDTIELKPLLAEYAKEMTIHYLEKEDVNCEIEDDLVEFIYVSCDYVPYYIEKIIKRLSLIEEGVVTLDTVKDEIELMLADDKNDLEMEHFVDRLEVYYDGMVKDVEGMEIKRSDIAKDLLGHLAHTDELYCADKCFNLLKTKYKIDDLLVVKEILSLLAKDYYIKADEDKKYQFTYTIIKRWWVKNG